MKVKVLVIASFSWFSATCLLGQSIPLVNYLSTYHLDPISYLLFDYIMLDETILESNVRSKSTIAFLDSIYLKEGKPLIKISDNLVVFRNRNGSYKNYKLLALTPEFLILCSRLHRDKCACKEDLYVYSVDYLKPRLVRKIFTFSLKVNLIDQINELSNDSLSYDDFDTTCDIINYMNSR
jgi:hypothetical protein